MKIGKETYYYYSSLANSPFRAGAKICQTTICTIHDMERRKMQLYENGQLVKTRIYCGMYEKDTITDSTAREYCYISGGNGVTAVLINEQLYFLRRDVQGTITGLVNQNDTVVEEYSYDAWGRRRNPTDWTYDSVPQPQLLYRGYTMHEMLDEFGLINMNGRCYDPVVGRFLSPDIIVQNPNNTQCYNRYSYAINNPLKYSDPSGWSWTPIQAANHANMMAMTMTMRLQDNFQPSVIRSGSSSRGNGFLFGSNAIVFQNAEATLQMALGDIAHILSAVFGMPGLWGNPRNDATLENGPSGEMPVNEQQGIEDNKQPTVDNKSDSRAYVLIDDNVHYRIDAIPPGGKYYDKIDGVATCLYSEFVFKVPDFGPFYGTVVIEENCDVDLDFYGLGPILQGTGTRAGWKDVTNFNNWDLTRNGWQKLFDAAKLINN